MTDPNRNHAPIVELLEDEIFRARLLRDDSGKTVLHVYEGGHLDIPAEWLQGIIARFCEDC